MCVCVCVCVCKCVCKCVYTCVLCVLCIGSVSRCHTMVGILVWGREGGGRGGGKRHPPPAKWSLPQEVVNDHIRRCMVIR